MFCYLRKSCGFKQIFSSIACATEIKLLLPNLNYSNVFSLVIPVLAISDILTGLPEKIIGDVYIMASPESVLVC